MAARTCRRLSGSLLFTVKRYYRPEWGDNWREHFTVDRINGFLGHELKFDNQKLVGNYLRVGYDPDGSWRIYKLRPDFHPADKVQVEDDITASVVVPRAQLERSSIRSIRTAASSWWRTARRCCSSVPTTPFIAGSTSRPRRTSLRRELSFRTSNRSTREQAQAMVDHVVEFDKYTEPMKQLLREFRRPARRRSYVVSSAHPRIVDGSPSKNPRYLQKRPDLVNPRDAYLAEIGDAPGARNSGGRSRCIFR